MFKIRGTWICVLLLWVELGSLNDASNPSYAENATDLPLDDPNAIVRTVLSAFEAIEWPATGRGKATVVMEVNGKERYSRKADFMFKSHMSRVLLLSGS